MELNKRIEDAVETASYSFWAEIAKAFPEAKYGDMDPGSVMDFQNAMTEAARIWVNNNVPETPEPETPEVFEVECMATVRLVVRADNAHHAAEVMVEVVDAMGPQAMFLDGYNETADGEVFVHSAAIQLTGTIQTTVSQDEWDEDDGPLNFHR